MVSYIFRFEIDPARADEYGQKVQAIAPRIMKAPHLKEFRAYRPITGTSQVVAMYDFDDLAGFAAWWADEDVQKVFAELRPYQMHRDGELWGASAAFPRPLRPGQ